MGNMGGQGVSQLQSLHGQEAETQVGTPPPPVADDRLSSCLLWPVEI
jgi:hypothetical protein